MAQPYCVLNVSGETPVNLAHLEQGLFLFVQGCRGTSPLCSQLSQAAWIAGQWGLGCRTAGSDCLCDEKRNSILMVLTWVGANLWVVSLVNH